MFLHRSIGFKLDLRESDPRSVVRGQLYLTLGEIIQTHTLNSHINSGLACRLVVGNRSVKGRLSGVAQARGLIPGQ